MRWLNYLTGGDQKVQRLQSVAETVCTKHLRLNLHQQFNSIIKAFPSSGWGLKTLTQPTVWRWVMSLVALKCSIYSLHPITQHFRWHWMLKLLLLTQFWESCRTRCNMKEQPNPVSDLLPSNHTKETSMGQPTKPTFELEEMKVTATETIRDVQREKRLIVRTFILGLFGICKRSCKSRGRTARWWAVTCRK